MSQRNEIVIRRQIFHKYKNPFLNQALPGLAAAQPVRRGQQGVRQDQEDRVVQVLSQIWVLGRRPSSNNKPR